MSYERKKNIIRYNAVIGGLFIIYIIYQYLQEQGQ